MDKENNLNLTDNFKLIQSLQEPKLEFLEGFKKQIDEVDRKYSKDNDMEPDDEINNKLDKMN